MKLSLCLCTLLVAAPVLTAHAEEPGQPTRIQVALEKAFVPEGFDDNDLTQMVVTGQFSDTCHKVGPTEVKVDDATGRVDLVQTAYKYSDNCQRMVVPFSQVVGVGLLKAGKYEVDDATTSNVLGKLSVARATKTAADDYLYAPVVDADLLRGEVELRGVFTDRCTKVQNILVNTSNDAIVVQPIVRRYGNAAQCPTTHVPFRVRAKIPAALRRGEYLLHVRSMSGNSINKIVDVSARRP